MDNINRLETMHNVHVYVHKTINCWH